MSLNSAGARLASAASILTARWHHTRNYWRDTRGMDFEKKFVDNLLAEIKRTQISIGQIGELMDRVRSECE